MKNSKYRYLVPNGFTFISLMCGVVSLMSAVAGNYFVAGYCILGSYILDLLDGASARRLNASSEFGLQLDSLVDMVSLGVAPAMLAFSYVQGGLDTAEWGIWLATIFMVMAGAYRLARFNLLPPKTTGRKDSVGLTITAAGATIALAVLADHYHTTSPHFTGDLIPNTLFVPFMVILSVLMVSRIPYPSFGQVFGHKWLTPLSLGGAFLLWYFLSFIHAWFLCNLGYLAVSLARAGYHYTTTDER